MEVKLEKTYELDVDAASAWALLSDLRQVAGCMPGAEITEQIDANSYKGAVKVKVGPALAQFGGTVDVLECEPQSRRMVMRGKGADKSGSSASMDLNAVIEPAADGAARSLLHGQATVVVNGKFAQFGGRMMTQVSEMMLGQFVDNFRVAARELAAQQAATATSPAAASDAAGPADQTPAPSATPRQAAREINGLALLWALIKGWFGGLFVRRVQ
jgi:carbon monoxide dehydrogenase subunit G